MEPVEVRTIAFASGDGTRLEGDLLSPVDVAGTAVVCHPHPLYGGTRADMVVAALCRGLVEAQHRVLRFDFRGTGGSAGSHDGGVAECDDLRAAIDAVDPGPDRLTIAGYSFGADIALSVEHPAAVRWLVVAPPLQVRPADEMIAGRDPRPTHIVQPAHDQFNPPERLRESVAEWNATTVHVVESTDHFLGGAHNQVSELARELVG